MRKFSFIQRWVVLIPFAIMVCSSSLLIGEPFSNPPDGTELKVFLPGIISDGLPNRDMTISPAMDELFYTVQQRGGKISVIMHARFRDGKWTIPAVASFSGMYTDLEPSFSPDGNSIFFSSKRIWADTLQGNFDIWKVDRAKNGWSAPQHLPGTVNSDKDEFYPSVTRNGNLYFTRDVGEKKEDILVAIYRDGKFEEPESLPAAINSSGFEFNAYVDPDEEFIIFTGFRRKDDMGGGDLYISRMNAGQWAPAENMGPTINSTALDYCAFVSPGKKFLFFTSSRNILKQPFTTKRTRQQIEVMLGSPGNGFDDIYWTRFRQ